MYTSKDIIQSLNAEIIGNTNFQFSNLLIDSRQLTNPKETLFIAIKSLRNDGHQYISELYKKGVRCFLVSNLPTNYLEYSDASFFIVTHTLQALQHIAEFHRKQFTLPVIGITGSNGKTIVKEWIYQLLKNDYAICRSPKSYNSQVGVPLSVWKLNQQHQLGLFEAGISEPDEMQKLEKIIQPTIGILTNIGSAHNQEFASREEKLNQKLQLFKHCETTIINAFSLTEQEIKNLKLSSVFIIGNSINCDLQLIDVKTTSQHTQLFAKFQNQNNSIIIPFSDKASIENALTCWALLLILKIPQSEIERKMLLLQAVEMRMELKLGTNNNIIINDSYNSDLQSLEIALHHQKQQWRGGKKIIILSDIEQSGKEKVELYTNVGNLLNSFQLDLVIGIGDEISSMYTCFNPNSLFYPSTNSFLNDLKTNHKINFSNSIILLKGSRSFEFEKISKQLQQKSHDTVLEINLNHLTHNINFYRSQIDKNVKIMCMVKATGYGSGSTEIAFTLQHHHIDYLAVAYADEGVELRKAGIHLPIMVMNPEESSYDDIIEYNLEPEIYSYKVANDFLNALQSKAIAEPYPVHIKIDTGMKRLGFEYHEIEQLAQFLKTEINFKVQSVFSHLVASDNANFDDFTEHQISVFEKAYAIIENKIGYSFIKHICNSGAITRFKNAHYSMVRLGIGMYGIGFNDAEKNNLIGISTLKTKISQLKHVAANETVGYNRTGIASKNSVIATIPIGYADGFSRQLGNGLFSVLVNGKACKTIGNICMDMCMIDVTDNDCKEGDEVIIFENNAQLLSLSQAMSTIPYEVLTSISSRVKRVYVQE